MWIYIVNVKQLTKNNKRLKVEKPSLEQFNKLSPSSQKAIQQSISSFYPQAEKVIEAGVQLVSVIDVVVVNEVVVAVDVEVKR